jgi:Spy/CpxP family protein refolding chaperone
MRRFTHFTLELAVAALAVTTASAVAEGPFQAVFEQPYYLSALLDRPDVQSDLKLTSAQQAKANDLARKARQEQSGLAEQLTSASPEQRQKLQQEIRAEESRRLGAVLDPAQQKRLRQIRLHLQGLSAVFSPTTADELNLTAGQRGRIWEIMGQYGQAVREIFQSGGDPRPRFEALRKETDGKILAVLTVQQRNSWKDMEGPPFKAAAPAGG